MRAAPWLRSPRRILEVERLEDRLAPAFDLAIGAVTAGVEVTLEEDVATFRAIASGASVNAADILTELAAGHDVVVDTGSDGSESGNIDWLANADLNFSTVVGTRTLTLRTDPSGTTRAVSLAADLGGSTGDDTATLSLVVEAGGLLTVNGTLTGLARVELTTAGQCFISTAITDINEAILVTAATISLDAGLEVDAFTATAAAPVVALTGNLLVVNVGSIRAANSISQTAGTIGLTGAVTMLANLELDLGSTGGTVQHTGGLLNLGIHMLKGVGGPVTLNLGTGSTLGGTGTVEANLVVGSQAVVAPAGKGIGTLTVVGTVQFLHGSLYEANIGASSDQLNATGTVSIQSNAELDLVGTATSTWNTLIATLANLNGRFKGTGSQYFEDGEVIQASYQVAAPGDLQVRRAPGAKTVIALTSSGDVAHFALTGGGKARIFVVDNNADGVIDLLLVRQSGKKNSLTVTVLPNGGDGTVQVLEILVQGNIGSITAPAARLGDVSAGKLSTLTALSLESGDVNVFSVDTVTAPIIQNVNFQSASRIRKLASHSINGLTLTASSLGRLIVRSNLVANLPGNLSSSTVTLTGNFGRRKEGLTAAVIDGGVDNSTFHVLAGHVGSFTAARFVQSRLYVGYAPAGSFETVGNFTGTNWRIRDFRTTAVPTAFSGPAFVGSELVASRFGTITLSSVGLDNAGVLFGLRVKPGTKKDGAVFIGGTPGFNAAVDYSPTIIGAVIPTIGNLSVQGDFRYFV